MKVMNPGNIDAQPTADAADHHSWEGYVRAKVPIVLQIVHLDGGDAGGDIEVSITRDGHEAILKEVVGPCLIAVDTCVDMMCVSTPSLSPRGLFNKTHLLSEHHKGDHRGTSDCWR